MLTINQIPDFIQTKVGDIPTIVYIGVGSEFLPRDREPNLSESSETYSNVKIWEPNQNQQFPLFLQNFKLFNPDVQIIILLIDGVIRTKPLIVQETDRFYSGTWTNDYFPNVFESEQLITVATFKNNIDWHNLSNNPINPINMLIQLIKNIESTNTILFYHEFTGLDVSIVENQVMKKLGNSYDRNKVCIDISRGEIGDCFPDFSTPILYPIINKCNNTNQLIYMDPRNIDLDYKLDLYQKINNLNPDKNLRINLFDRVQSESILYIQLTGLNKVIINKVCNSVFVILRQIKINSEPIPDLSASVESIKYLSYEFIDIFDIVVHICKLITNCNKDKETIMENKIAIINLCYDIIVYFAKKLYLNYSTNEMAIEDLVIEMKNTTNLYNLANVYKNFFIRRNLM